jgi:hypothetical protein
VGYVEIVSKYLQLSLYLQGYKKKRWRNYVHLTGFFKFMWPCIVTNRLFNKTNRNTNFLNLFLSRNSTCFGQSVSYHKESSTVWCHIPVPNVQWRTPDDGQRDCAKHVEFPDKNKFGKLVGMLVLLKRNLARCAERNWSVKEFIFKLLCCEQNFLFSAGIGFRTFVQANRMLQGFLKGRDKNWLDQSILCCVRYHIPLHTK